MLVPGCRLGLQRERCHACACTALAGAVLRPAYFAKLVMLPVSPILLRTVRCPGQREHRLAAGPLFWRLQACAGGFRRRGGVGLGQVLVCVGVWRVSPPSPGIGHPFAVEGFIRPTLRRRVVRGL